MMNRSERGRGSKPTLGLIFSLAVVTMTPVIAVTQTTTRGALAATPPASPVRLDVHGALNVRIATPAPTATPVPTPTPSPTPLILNYAQRTIFVVALATDAPTAAKISNEVALQMNGFGAKDRGPHPFTNPFFPEPGWQLADYLTQCSRDRSTAGALIIMPPVVRSATNNFLIGSAAFTSVDFFAVLADCDEHGQANVLWKSDREYSGKGNATSVSLLSLLVGYNAIANHSGSSQTQTTVTYPTAPPTATPSPLPAVSTPPPSYVSSQVNSTTSNTNGNSNLGLVGAALATALGNTASAGVTSAGDHQLLIATQRATRSLAKQLVDLRSSCDTTVLQLCKL